MQEPAHPLHIAVIGAGPVGLGLALHAATQLPQAHVTVFDARPLDRDVSGDPRTLALSLGSIQTLERLGVWSAVSAASCPIHEVHVSQQQPALLWPGSREPVVRMSAAQQGVAQLGVTAQALDRRGDERRLRLVPQQAGATERPRLRGGGAGDDRHAERHRFDERHAESFVRAQRHEGIGAQVGRL